MSVSFFSQLNRTGIATLNVISTSADTINSSVNALNALAKVAELKATFYLEEERIINEAKLAKLKANVASVQAKAEEEYLL